MEFFPRKIVSVQDFEFLGKILNFVLKTFTRPLIPEILGDLEVSDFARSCKIFAKF